ncbi:hypothetical protein MMC31_002826 [Peltigera leucophlebia]|nr:hypothetical protein [Peltigera leucophlebia]
MKFSYAASVLLALGLAIAAPAQVERRAPSNAPINLEHGPDNDKTYHCGHKDYTGHDIYLSAQRGINLKIAGETRGRKSLPDTFPLLPSAIITTQHSLHTGNAYPHPFDNDDSKGNKLNFPSFCPADKSRYEFPLKNPVYDGGKNNVNQGDERVVYYWAPGDIDYEGNPNVQYCGIMTHVGAPSGGFVLC